MSDSRSELKLNSPPEDGVSSVKFGPASSQFVLASSWDCTVRLYDVEANTQRLKYSHAAPVLDCCFHDAVHAWSGGLDNQLKMYDFNSSSETVVGQHAAPIRCIEFAADVGVVVSGGWDNYVKLWDPRAARAASAHAQYDKVYAMSTCGQKLVVGTASRKVQIWDLRSMAQPLEKKDSSLKYQTRCIRCFPNQLGYVLSSIEGRVAVEYFDTSPEEQKKKYAFKCHRIKESGMEYVYPVNAISFHRQHNTFATGGSDGYVNIWDGLNKKRLCQFHRYPTSIASLAFSPDGSVLAIASSYLYEQTEPPATPPPDAIYIRHVTDQEAKPK